MFFSERPNGQKRGSAEPERFGHFHRTFGRTSVKKRQYHGQKIANINGKNVMEKYTITFKYDLAIQVKYCVDYCTALGRKNAFY